MPLCIFAIGQFATTRLLLPIPLLILLLLIPSDHSSISMAYAVPLQFSNSNQPEKQQELAAISAECRSKLSKKGAELICDPRGILRPKERHSLRQQLKLFRAKTSENPISAQEGMGVGIVLSHWDISGGHPTMDDNHFVAALDQKCQKYILLLLPVYELDRISIIHGPGVPLRGSQLHFVVEQEKPLLRQGRYLEGISAILEGIRLLMDQSAEYQQIYRVQIEERRRNDGGGGKRAGNEGRREIEQEEEEEEEAEAMMMTRSFLALIASCAVLFSLLLSITAFLLFYYLSIVRHGGMACWGDRKIDKSGGVYFVKEVSVERTTMVEDLVGGL